MYSSKILEIFKNPSNFGGLQGANAIGKYIDETCGDCVKLYLKVDEHGEIDEARFKTMGAVGTIVASSALCQVILGLTLEEAKQVTKEQIMIITGKYPEDKEYTLNFVLNALTLAIQNYYERLEKEEKKEVKEKKVKIEKTVIEKIENENENQVQEQLVNSEVMDSIAKAQAEGLISEEEHAKASSLIDGAKYYTSVVETKILSDEDLKRLEAKREANKPSNKSVSSAKAMFDAMFEE